MTAAPDLVREPLLAACGRSRGAWRRPVGGELSPVPLRISAVAERLRSYRQTPTRDRLEAEEREVGPGRTRGACPALGIRR